MDNFHIYIHFPDVLKLNTREEAEQTLRHIQMILDRADCEKDAQLYFDNTSKNGFFNELELQDDILEFVGGQKLQDVIRLLLQDAGAKNWENGPCYDLQKFYYKQWISANGAHTDDFLNVWKEITERKSRDIDSHEAFLFLSILEKPIVNFIHIIKDSFTTLPPVLINIDYVTNFSELEIWFNHHRDTRNYNFNDNRHIENNPTYIPDRSPLLGGIGGKQNVADLLKTALGDPREIKDLMNFDELKGRYIWYEYEGAQNQYHGYHLAKPKTHERDIVAEEKIPPRVKALLEYRATL